jgi:hypothetical protein
MSEEPIKTDKVQSPIAPQEPNEKPSKKKKITIILIIVGVVLIIGWVIFAIIYFNMPKSNPKTSNPSIDVVYKPTDTDPSVAKIDKPTNPVWNTPKIITDPGVFADIEAFYGIDYQSSMATDFYKVGSDNGRDIILADVKCTSGCSEGQGPYLFINDKTDHYLLLANHSFDAFSDSDYVGPTLSSNTQIDTTDSYTSIAYQAQITLGKAQVTNADKYVSLFANIQDNTSTTLTHYADTKYGEMLIETNGSHAQNYNVEIQDFVLHRPDGTAVIYQLRPSFMSDDNIPRVTWTDGSTNTDTFRTDAMGSCGVGNGLAVLTSGIQDLQPAGKTDNSETVYEFTNKDNATFKFFYDSYAESTAESGTTISADQFITNHGVMVYKDALDRYIVFSNLKYGTGAECGKPVIYLYPTKPTNISITVDAKITKSSPTYNNGWKVTAYPNGNLIVNNKPYDSLFWEGIGKKYPTIDNGFVIAQSNLSSTIHSQLSQLGLNDKETNDFMAFWIPKMPKTPYVRLTWFGTNQMNQLAPLHVNPKPDTTIRIFLDFEGLDQKISLPIEYLSAPARKGFTLVEWGGLLQE